MSAPAEKPRRRGILSWIGRGLLLFCAGIGAMVLVSSVMTGIILGATFGQPPELPERIVLTWDASKPLAEQGVIALDPSLLEPPLLMLDFVEALERAAADPRVVGLVAEIGESEQGFASVQEVRDALALFRESDKPTIAFADTFGELSGGTTAYYLATGFDEIWLQPMGLVGFQGLAADVPFARDLLDAWGVEPQATRRGAYKTALDPLLEYGMTPAFREMLESLVGDIMDRVLDDVAAARGIDRDVLAALMNDAPIDADRALNGGLIDRIGYRDEILAGGDLGTATPLPLEDYLAATQPRPREGPVVALVVVDGEIARGPRAVNPIDGTANAGARTLEDIIGEVAEENRFDALLLRVNSPGGSVTASETIRRAVARVKDAGKPVVVSMADVAGSGGYFIAVDADRILAQPATLTGSIGVIAGKLVIEEGSEELGVAWEGVTFGENAGMDSAVRPFTEPQRARFEALVDATYAGFKQRVADGRGLSVEGVEAIAQGRVWTGRQGTSIGLIDRLGGYPVAREELARLLNAPPGEVNLQVHPRRLDPLEALIALLTGQEPGEIRMATPLGARALSQLARLAGMLGLGAEPPALRQARMPPLGLDLR